MVHLCIGWLCQCPTVQQINALLRRFFKCCFTSRLWDFDFFYCTRWIHSCLRVCRIASIVSTVYSRTPETFAHFTRRRNNPCIWTPVLSLQLLSVFPCQPVPLQFYLIYGFILYYFELIYNRCPYNVFACIYIYRVVQKVSHYQESSFNCIKNRHCGYISH